MKAKNFELFIGYLGNGATVCNSAVYEHGDYKTVAHISPAGNIELYVAADYIPEEAMQEIKATAERHKVKTLQRLQLELSNEYNFYRVLDEICNYTPYRVSEQLFNDLKQCKTEEARREVVTKCYMQNL